MKPTNAGRSFVVLLITITSTGFPAQPNWSGEYVDRNFLNGQAAFHLSIEQAGNAIQIVFDAAYADAHGAAPDGEGPAKIKSKNTLEFKWQDSFNNSGTGTIKRLSDGVIVSMKTTRVVDERCLTFYGEKMRLKRVK